VLLGNGDGSFRSHIDLPVGGAPRAVAVGDFNRDGKLDVVTAQQLTDSVSVLLGHGNGTFAPPLVFAASGADFTPESMVVADVNADGKLDLAIKSVSFLESDAFQVGVLLGKGDGTFQAPLLGDAQPDGSGDLALGDFNHDGRLDAAVADELGAPSGNLSVFAGNGDGTFQSLIRLDLLTGGNGPKGVAAVDLNGDGLVDLVASNSGDSPGTVGVLLNASAPRVAGVTVDGGAAQRSRVTNLSVTFSTQVSFATTPGAAFTLTRNSDGAAVTFTATVSAVNGATVVTLNGFSGTATQFGSLADGNYTLTTLANQVSAGGSALDGNGDGTGGDNNTQGVFRLFGDVNGDQTVNGLDFGFFKNAFGTQVGDANYLSFLDFDGDGVINGLDFGQFRTRFGTALP
jgi:hypothetical protein